MLKRILRAKVLAGDHFPELNFLFYGCTLVILNFLVLSGLSVPHLSKLRDMVKDRETWLAAVHGVGKRQNNNNLAFKLTQLPPYPLVLQTTESLPHLSSNPLS